MSLSEEVVNSLVIASLEAKKFAYAKYSNFRVGCALMTECGKVFKGCNVENVSYGLTICAERTAYVKAVSEGYSKFSAIAVSTDVKGRFVSPCGACRQFMSEFGDIQVILADNDKQTSRVTLSKLLPMSFDEDALQNGKKNAPNCQ